MPKFLRRLFYGLAIAGGVLGLAVAAGLLWLRSGLPTLEGDIGLPGLGARVEVLRDPDGLVTILAEDEWDATFALGFVHAQDRLWQMNFLKRTAQGRLSEIVGEATLGIDRYMRTLDLAGVAEANFAALSAAPRAHLEAYAAGVNAAMDRHTGPWSLPFLLLRYEPEAWRPEDSLLWGRLMALQLSGNWRDELRRAAVEEVLPDEMSRLLWPLTNPNHPTTLAPDRAASLVDQPLRALLNAIPEELRPRDASNAWVVDGSRNDTRLPILANDPHLELSAPGLWYLVRIETPQGLLVGASAPGIPYFLLGHNGSIAWGMTTTHADSQDLFLEQVDPADPKRYRTPQGWRKFEVREVEIGVKDGEPRRLTVRRSRHGPLVDGLLPKNSKTQALALSWPALRGDDRTGEALYRLNRATGWEAFQAALEDFHSPVQNIVYADRAGRIGFSIAGRLPLRGRGDGRRPLPGWESENDWRGFLPADALPRASNPPAGYFVSANNRVVGEDYPHLITADWPSGLRAARITALLEAGQDRSLEGNWQIFFDTYSGGAAVLLPLLLAAVIEAPELKKAIALLSDWDLKMDRDRPEALLYVTWMTVLNEALIKDELGDLYKEFQRPDAVVLAQILRQGPEWCDNKKAIEAVQDCGETITKALRLALRFLHGTLEGPETQWRWGEFHRARFAHPILDKAPLLPDLFELTLETDGGDTTLNRGGLRYSAPDDGLFENIHGPGYRALYDLSNLDNSRFVIATGQSGNPLSAFYGSLRERWRDGGYPLSHLYGHFGLVRLTRLGHDVPWVPAHG